MPPDCDDASLSAGQFPQVGFNTAWRHPPTYFAVTSVLLPITQRLPGAGDLLDAARFTGLFWMALSVIILWKLLDRFDLPRPVILSMILVLLAAPAVLFYIAVVSPDGASIAAGAAVLLAARLFEEGDVRPWVPPAIGFFAGALKWTNLMGVVVAAIYLISRARVGSGSRRARTTVVVAAGLVGASLLAVIGWYVIQAGLARMPDTAIPLIQQQQVDSLQLGQVLEQTRQLVTPLRVEYLPAALSNTAVFLLVVTMDLGLVILLLMASLRPRGFSRRSDEKGVIASKGPVEVRDWVRPLAAATLFVMATSAVAFVVIGYLLFGVFNQVQPRFGLSLLPAAACVVGGVSRGRRGRWILTAFAFAVATVVGVSLLFGHP